MGVAVAAAAPIASTPSTPVTPVAFTLPTPPSVNQLFRNAPGRGRVKTRAYNDWRAHALTVLRLQRIAPVPGRVLALFAVERMSLCADIDNRIKAMLDIVVAAGILGDDNQVTGFCAAWTPPANGLAHIRLFPVNRLGIEFHPSADGATGGWYEAPQQDDGEENGFVS